MESFKAGRKWRNGITQMPGFTDDDTQPRKSTEAHKHVSTGTEAWIWGL